MLGVPRTQNVVESWHNRLNILVNRKHTRMEKVLKVIQAEEHAVRISLNVLLLGGGTDKRDDYRKREEKLKEILNSQGNLPVMIFLERLAYRLKVTKQTRKNKRLSGVV